MSDRRRRKAWGAALVFATVGPACRPAMVEDGPAGRPAKSISTIADRPVVDIAFTTRIDPVSEGKFRQPLLDHLLWRTPYRFRVLSIPQSETTVGLLEQRVADAALLSVVSYLEARSQLGVAPLVRPLNQEGEAVSYSTFVVKETSPLRDLGDLKGRSLALGSAHSTLSNLIPRYELIRAGLQPEDLGTIEHLDNDEAVATAVAEGRFDAGAVEDLVAHRFEEKGLKIIHVSDPVPSSPIVVRNNLPQAVADALRDALLELDSEGAKERQEWAEDIRFGFAPTTDADYDPVRSIVRNSPTGCTLTCHGNPQP
jgi:phosphonate transport system substrate-binding protein